MQQTRVCGRTTNSRSVSQQKIPFMNFFVVNNFITSCNGVGRNRSEFMHDVVDPDGAAASSAASCTTLPCRPLDAYMFDMSTWSLASPGRLCRRRPARGRLRRSPDKGVGRHGHHHDEHLCLVQPPRAAQHVDGASIVLDALPGVTP